MFTVTQTAKVANKIIPKTTQDGIIPPRRRTSVRVPRISTEICCTEARELVRGVTRCALIRSSTQYVFATLLTSHLRVPLRFHPCPEPFVSTQKLRGCLTVLCVFGHNIAGTS